jgi:hypothetical protein
MYKGNYEVGRTVAYPVDSSIGSVDACVVYNDGRYAVAAFEYHGDKDDDWFILSKEEVLLFTPANFGYDQNSYLLIDLGTGRLVERCDWLRKNDKLYVVGKEVEFCYNMISCIPCAVTVWVEDGIALVRVPYKSHLNEFYARFGYEKEHIRSVYPNFDDAAEDSVYMCVRIADNEILDIDGNSIEEHVCNCFDAYFERNIIETD